MDRRKALWENEFLKVLHGEPVNSPVCPPDKNIRALVFRMSGLAGISAYPPCRSPSLRDSAQGLHMRSECISDCNAELIEATLPVSFANGL